MGFPHVDFGSLVHALYDIKEGTVRGLWPESFLLDSKGKKPTIGKRLGDVSAIVPLDRGPLDIIKELGKLLEFIIRHHPMCSIGHLFLLDLCLHISTLSSISSLCY